MKTESMTLSAAMTQGAALPYAYVRSLSSVTLGPAPRSIDLETLLDARFFSQQTEIRIFRQYETWQAVRLTAEPEDRVILRTYDLENPNFGKRITICQVLDTDGDGQTFLATTRLTDWEGN
jgi:hypothetical protein